MKGTIFSIEDFAINDGPGIRTTVFLKGCPLRCSWCHNPEGWSPLPETRHKPTGDEVGGQELESGELIALLRKDKDLYAMNAGGVTFTGGEPTMQAPFLCEVLDGLKDIHTAIETSGYCSEAVFRALLDRLNLVMFDIKHPDGAVHRKYTGVDNAPILRNLRVLIESGKAFVARVPLIPGVNDSLETMERVRGLLSGATGLQRLELLRYNSAAGAKYPMLGMEYHPSFDATAAPAIHDVFEGINTLIL